jgi:hypothetical protein
MVADITNVDYDLLIARIKSACLRTLHEVTLIRGDPEIIERQAIHMRIPTAELPTVDL